MRDLTRDSIFGHVSMMAIPAAISMLAQILNQLVSLYFIADIGVTATAGVNAAGNVVLFVNALNQVVGAGTVALVSQAIGRKNPTDADQVFNQGMVLAIGFGLLTILLICSLGRWYLRTIASDPAVIEAGAAFFWCVMPGFFLSLPMAVYSASLRATGLIRPPVIAYIVTLLVNAALAPFLIAGWGTGLPLGAYGAGLATSISFFVGILILGGWFRRLQPYMTVRLELMRPNFAAWRRILNIGLPAGAEFSLTFMVTAVAFYAIRDLGASAQAGFAIGSRVLQAVALPAFAVALAAGPIAGQNFGAKESARVRETFRTAAFMGVGLMAVTTLLVQWQPHLIVSIFGTDAASLDVAESFLRLTSWTLVAQGLIFVCSTMFQGLGNTIPSLVSSAIRLVAFCVPVLWASTLPGFHIEQVWHLFVAAVVLQAMVSWYFLKVEFSKRLRPLIHDTAKDTLIERVLDRGMNR